MYESSDLLLYPKSPSVSVTVSSSQILTLLFILSAWRQNVYSEAPRSSSLPTGLQVCCSAAFLPKPASSAGAILGHVLGLTPSAFFLLGFWAPLAGGGVGVGWEYSGIPGGGQRAKGCLSPRGSGFLRGFTDQWRSPSYSFSICTHLRLAVCITYPWSVGAKLFIEWVRRPPGTGWAAGPIGLEPQATLGPWS